MISEPDPGSQVAGAQRLKQVYAYDGEGLLEARTPDVRHAPPGAFVATALVPVSAATGLTVGFDTLRQLGVSPQSGLLSNDELLRLLSGLGALDAVAARFSDALGSDSLLVKLSLKTLMFPPAPLDVGAAGPTSARERDRAVLTYVDNHGSRFQVVVTLGEGDFTLHRDSLRRTEGLTLIDLVQLTYAQAAPGARELDVVAFRMP